MWRLWFELRSKCTSLEKGEKKTEKKGSLLKNFNIFQLLFFDWFARLQRFEKTNEMLTNCNALSVNRLASAGTEFKKHTQLLVDMKKDLDQIFRRISTLKNRLSHQYPQGFAGLFCDSI